MRNKKASNTVATHKTPLQKLEDKLSAVNDEIIECEDDQIIAKLESKAARIEQMIAKEMARLNDVAQA